MWRLELRSGTGEDFRGGDFGGECPEKGRCPEAEGRCPTIAILGADDPTSSFR